MKILLIETSRTYSSGSKGIRMSLPLGLLYIATPLEKAGYSVSIYSCLCSPSTRVLEHEGVIHHGVDDDDFKEMVIKEKPDIVGISCPFTAQFDQYVYASQLVKEVDQNIFVVGGGPHFSVCGSNFLLKNLNTDCYISGEGEEPMLALVANTVNNISLNGIPGITYRNKNDGTIKSMPNEYFKEMDDLEFPAYHLFNMDLYFEYQRNGCKGYNGPISARLDQDGKRTVSIITSRGCPFKCTFCSVALHMGKPVRAHSSEYIIKHIQLLVDYYSIEHIFFEDDNLTFRVERMQNISEEMTRKKFNLTWSTPNGVRADKLTKPLIMSMKESGCTGLIIGTESGDQNTLDNIVKKDLDLKTVVKVAAWCKELDISLTSFFVIGFPKETIKTIQNTIDFAVMLYGEYNVLPLLNNATPLIGSELYDIAVKDQLLVTDVTPDALSTATQPLSGVGLIKTNDFSPSDLFNFAKQLDERIGAINPDFDVSYHT